MEIFSVSQMIQKEVTVVEDSRLNNYVITIARGFGSGGRTIAGMLGDRLGIPSYEHRILAMASRMTGRDEDEFEEVDERLRGKSLADRLRGLQKRLSPHAELNRFTSDDRLYEAEANIIRELGKSENCIIVGKAADYVLKDQDNVLSVYIEAPRDFCRKMVMDRMNIGPEEADRLITSTDRYRADYYQYYSRGNYWTNPVNYDITLNSERFGLEKCVDMIINALQIKFDGKFHVNIAR